MYKNIFRIGFSRLKKLEVQFLASSVIEIVEKYDPETLNIKEIFDKLVEQTPQIDLLRVAYGPHPITSDLNMLRTRRDAFAQDVINQMKTAERAKESGKEDALKVAKPVLLRYLKTLSRKSEKSIRQTLIQFFDLVNTNEDISTAINSLGLTSNLDSLRGVHSAIDRKYNSRRENISARPKEKTPYIVSTLKVALHDMFKEIEVAQKKYPALDYTQLIDELNIEIAKAKAEVKARQSYNKKKAEEALNNKEVVEGDNEVVIESTSEKPSAATQSTNGMYPMNVEVDKEDNLEQLDIKKTVAVSTKQTRLPIVSTEA